MANSTGNTNQLGVAPVKTTSLAAMRPGRVTRGPGTNKPRIHLVSSKDKIPAAVIAAVVAKRQAQKAVNPTVNTHPELASETLSARDGANVDRKGGNPKLHQNQLTNPRGVAKRPAPKHQVLDRRTVAQKLHDATKRNPQGIL